MGQSFCRRILLCLALIVGVLAVPIPVFAQGAVVVPADAPWWLVLLGTVVPLVSGWLAKFLADGLKQIAPWYESQSSFVKLAVSTLIGFAVGWLNTHLLGDISPLGTDFHHWTADMLGGVLTALAQAGIYRLDKNKQLAAQGSATLEQRVDGTAPRPVNRV